MNTFNRFLILVLSITLFYCGNKKEEKDEGFTYENKTSEDSSTTNIENPNEIVITGNDAMQFNKNEIKVEAGKKVKITLKHIGKMDKNVMGHNFVLLKQGVNLALFGNAAATARENDYIPQGTDDVIAHTKMIGGGETAIVEFDAPAPGTYEFLCSFPGHYALMKGKFIVE